MAPIISTLSVNGWGSTGGSGVPDYFEAILIAGGGGTAYGRGGAGGLISMSGQPNWRVNATSFDFTQSFSVTVGAGASWGSNGGDTKLTHNGSTVNNYARGGGAGSIQDGYGGQGGGSGGAGFGNYYTGGKTGTCGQDGQGGCSLGGGWGNYPTQGHQGGHGARGAPVDGYPTYSGTSGGFGSAGNNAVFDGTYGSGNGYGGGLGSTLNSTYIWLGKSTDNTSYNGVFCQGNINGKPGNGGGYSGLLAIRYLSDSDDPTVTGNPTFYDDTDGFRIIVWTGAGTFNW
jgi:hypothetical protein